MHPGYSCIIMNSMSRKFPNIIVNSFYCNVSYSFEWCNITATLETKHHEDVRLALLMSANTKEGSNFHTITKLACRQTQKLAKEIALEPVQIDWRNQSKVADLYKSGQGSFLPSFYMVRSHKLPGKLSCIYLFQRWFWLSPCEEQSGHSFLLCTVLCPCPILSFPELWFSGKGAPEQRSARWNSRRVALILRKLL